jgi:hypothetical protein
MSTKMVPLTTLSPPMPDHVGRVLARRRPSQISQTVVGWVAVPMGGFMALGTGTDKGFQDEAMDLVAHLVPVLAEPQGQVSASIGRGAQYARRSANS